MVMIMEIDPKEQQNHPFIVGIKASNAQNTQNMSNHKENWVAFGRVAPMHRLQGAHRTWWAPQAIHRALCFPLF